MCSIAMPTDYEMLVSHSPPIFNPQNDFVSRYEAYRQPRNCKPKLLAVQSPKPCLVVKEEDTSRRLKKRVIFADDKGLSLTHVRVMKEPSNVPPVWSFKFLAQVTHGITAEPVARQDPWEITFSQPASDYVEFRKQLDINKVSLENVIIKEAEEMIVGTVKVSNISFEKEVLLRTSSDNWKTHEDVYCVFVANSSGNSVYVVYDTFSFKLPFPPKSRAIEFCVCFRCNHEEFWDNNNGHNYKLVKKAGNGVRSDPILVDIFHAKVDSWSEFASWDHLDEHPYW